MSLLAAQGAGPQQLALQGHNPAIRRKL